MVRREGIYGEEEDADGILLGINRSRDHADAESILSPKTSGAVGRDLTSLIGCCSSEDRGRHKE